MQCAVSVYISLQSISYRIGIIRVRMDETIRLFVITHTIAVSLFITHYHATIPITNAIQHHIAHFTIY